MPARPAWISRINDICSELDRLPRPFVAEKKARELLTKLKPGQEVDRATLELLLQMDDSCVRSTLWHYFCGQHL